MKKYGISKEITNTIQSLYEHAKSLVMVGDKHSNCFFSKIEDRQGCVLSACLFNLFLEFIMTEAHEGFNGTVTDGGISISNLRFADDIDLIAGNESDLRQLNGRLDKTSAKYGMEINAGKSEILVTSKEEIPL